MLADKLPRLIFPAIAVWFSGYMLFEQYTGNYRSSTQSYVGTLAILVILMCTPIIITIFRNRDTGGTAGAQWEIDEAKHLPEARSKFIKNMSRIGIIVGLAALLVATLEQVGYLVGFTVFVASALRLLDVRKLWLLATITALTIGVVHFIFVKWLSVNLPAGFLQGIV